MSDPKSTEPEAKLTATGELPAGTWIEVHEHNGFIIVEVRKFIGKGLYATVAELHHFLAR